MRRFFFSAAIMAIVAGGPLQVQAGDREIAQQIIDNLKVHRDDGTLKDFTLDLKVDQGVVLLRGSVQRSDQKASVLAAAGGIDGISKIVDEIEVRQAGANGAKAPNADQATTPAVQPGEVKPGLIPATNSDRFSFKNALATAGPSLQRSTDGGVAPAGTLAADHRPGAVQRVAATEGSADAQITAEVVATLGAAQRQGRLKGFGVDVNTRDGSVVLNGRASSQEQRRLIADLVRSTPGVIDVRDEIAVIPSGGNPELKPLPRPQGGTPAMTASSRHNVPVQTAPYRMDQGPPMNQVAMGTPAPGCIHTGMPVHGGIHSGMSMQGGVHTGMPVPMGPYAGVAAGPRYEQPYLPNYAWPGYAAYPNYAAVSYPQQYSPSAFPYIGPFYPYPQVPLGWRKVSLEWDDGWWFLDFTDR